jgi:glutathione S-transferase
MMILRTSPPSPFGRKVNIAAAVLGLSDQIKIERADAIDPADPVRRQNPLGKIPVLILADGTAVYDSRVILEYLDHHAGGGRIIPAEPSARFVTLRLQALADGILDAAILQVYEGRWRAVATHEPKWLAHQADKVSRALSALEADPPTLDPLPQVGQIATACALGYLDFRFDRTWRGAHPRLVAWLEAFAAKIPAYAATQVAA